MLLCQAQTLLHVTPVYPREIPLNVALPSAPILRLERAGWARNATMAPAALIAAALGGCATGQDLGSGTTGSVGSPQSYVLTAAEQNWHCEQLDNAVQARITKIAALTAQAKAENTAAAPTVTRLFSRMFSEPGSDSTALAQIKPERSAADAYNVSLAQKGCPRIDIEAKLAAAAAASPVTPDAAKTAAGTVK